MTKSARGWSNAHRLSKPASSYDIRYGTGLLRQESSCWPPYVVVSTPQAYETSQRYLARLPAGVVYAEWLDWGHLGALSDRLPNNAELVIGLGGGRALDASKYIALIKDLPMISVPTVVSTGAIIHSNVAKWKGRTIIGPGHQWPWVDPEQVLVDYDVVLAAPPYLNTAGLGDVLCGYAGVAEWQYNAQRGIGPQIDRESTGAVLAFHEELASGFPMTLDPAGQLTAESIRFIVDGLLGRETLLLPHNAAPGGDHDFVFALELANEKGWSHGEVVALGAIIIAWQCHQDPQSLLARLDACQVRRRPSEIGISKEELRKGLAYTPTYMADKANGRDTNSILRHEPAAGAQFEALWEFLEKC